MFLAHVTPFFMGKLAEFPKELAHLLKSSARTLSSSLRCHVAQALILLVNRQILDIGETLSLFMELQTLGDRNLRKLAFDHVIHSIKHMNQKHKNEAKNRTLQNILFIMLQQEDEILAKRALVTLCELHKRKLWFDERTANAICAACFHSSSKIMIATLSFLLDYEKIDSGYKSDDSCSDDEPNPLSSQIVIGREAIYKASHQGTLASKKKKKAKLQRAMRRMKRQQRQASEKSGSNHYTPLNHLKDAQGFAEKLFAQVKKSNKPFEIKMMMLKLISRTIGLHRLVVLNFYSHLQIYAKPQQEDVTSLLAAAVQACHDMVPPDAVEPLFKQIVNWFIHDKSRTEVIAVGLNAVREICLRIPLLMDEDLLQDLVLYKKSHEKAISTAARSLIQLFRELCPSLLIKRDRWRPANPTARPKAFGETSVFSDVPGLELLKEDIDNDEDDDDNETLNESASGDEIDDDVEVTASDDDQDESSSDDGVQESDNSDDDDSMNDAEDVSDENSDMDSDEEDSKVLAQTPESGLELKSKKRKFTDFDPNSADTSLRALKKLAGGEKTSNVSLDSTDGFLSNEDFQRIKELEAKKYAKNTLAQHGIVRKSIRSSDQLSHKRVDPSMLEVNIKVRQTKEEKLALVKAGRGGKFQAKSAIKKKKTGGRTNKEKEDKKFMPMRTKRSKIAKSKQVKMLKKGAGKQFRGKKGWK